MVLSSWLIVKICLLPSGAPEVLTVAELFARRQLKLTEKKEMIAEIAMQVIENPEENVCSPPSLILHFTGVSMWLSTLNAKISLAVAERF